MINYQKWLAAANGIQLTSWEALKAGIVSTTKAMGVWLATTPAGWATMAGVAIAGVVLGVNAYNKKIQEGINNANEAKSATQEQIDTLADYKNKIEELRTSLKNSNLSEEEAYETRKKLISIQDELSDKYGIEKDKIDLINGSLKEQINLLDQASRQTAEDYLRDNKDAINNAIKKVEKTKSFNLAFDYSEFKGIGDLQDLLVKNNYAGFGEYSFDSSFTGTAEEAIKYYKELYDYVLKYKEENAIILKTNQDGLANVDIILADISNKINSINNEDYKNSKELYDTAIQYLLITNDNYKNLYVESLKAQDDYYEAVASNNEEAIKKSLEDMKTAQTNYQNALNDGLIIDNGVARWFEDFYNDFIIQSNKYQFKVDVSINVDNIDTALKIAFSKINKENPTALDIKNLEFSTNPDDIQAFESLNYIASQYGMTIEEIIPILEDLGYVQKSETEIVTKSTRTHEELLETLETVSKKVKLITTAMEEQADTGYISSSTYAEIIEMGGNFADCLEIQNGKLKLNVEKLKELERQEILNAIAAKNLAISELNVAAAMAGQSHNAEKVEEIRKQITALEEERAVLWQINDEIANAKPNESGSGSGSSSSADPWKEQFDKQYSEKQHLLAMEQLSEEDYLDWLDGAYKQYFSDLTKYQDEYYKYEEEVYKGRKQLAEDFYDSQRDYYKNRVSDLETQIEITTKDSTDNNGNLLNAEEKFAYIRSVYSDILATIQEDINDIVQNGIEGHEDDLKALEQQYEKYVKEMADIFKDEVESEIDYIQDLQDTVEQAYDDEIDKIEAEKKAMEDRYDAEINKIDSVIDSIESKNKSEKLTNDLIKARQDLEKANRNKRLVFDSMGNQSYVADAKAVSEAQQAVKEAEQAITVNKLEEVKKAIEDEKTVLSQSYDNQLTELKEQKEQQKTFYDDLIKTLQDYLNPSKQTESNTNVWNTVAGEDGAVKVGNSEMSTSYIDSRISSEDAVKNIYKKMLKNSAWSDTDIDKALKNYDITKLLTALTNNNYKALGVNEALAGSSVTNAQSYVNNNSKQSVTISIGDVNITNPVGDTINLAKEITKQLPNAVIQEIYRNR